MKSEAPIRSDWESPLKAHLQSQPGVIHLVEILPASCLRSLSNCFLGKTDKRELKDRLRYGVEHKSIIEAWYSPLVPYPLNAIAEPLDQPISMLSR